MPLTPYGPVFTLMRTITRDHSRAAYKAGPRQAPDLTWRFTASGRLHDWRFRHVLHQAVGGVRRRTVLLDGGVGGVVGGHLLGELLDLVLGEVRRDGAEPTRVTSVVSVLIDAC